MSVFRYCAKDKSGKVVEGTIDSLSHRTAMHTLREMGLVCESLSKTEGSPARGAHTRTNFSRLPILMAAFAVVFVVYAAGSFRLYYGGHDGMRVTPKENFSFANTVVSVKDTVPTPPVPDANKTRKILREGFRQ